MAEYPFVARVDAFDYSAQSIVKAEEVYPHPKVRRVAADFASFAVDEPYDLVVSFQVFEHLSHPEAYLAFCRRATIRKGHIAILMPNRIRLANFLRILQFKRAELSDPQHYREYTAREAIALGRRAGFIPVADFGYGLAGTGFRFIDRPASTANCSGVGLCRSLRTASVWLCAGPDRMNDVVTRIARRPAVGGTAGCRSLFAIAIYQCVQRRADRRTWWFRLRELRGGAHLIDAATRRARRRYRQRIGQLRPCRADRRCRLQKTIDMHLKAHIRLSDALFNSQSDLGALRLSL